MVRALEEVSRQLEQQPSWFDWVSLVMVPAIVGMASLAIGFGAWRVARQSHALARQMREESEAARLRAERQDFAEDVSDYIFRAYRERAANQLASSSADKAATLTAKAFAIESPNALLLVAAVQRPFAEAGSSSMDALGGALVARNRAQLTLRFWVKDPSKVTELEYEQEHS
ncbi:hypothetical protein [Frigoribacterium faeni]|uniref:Small-conductance mechanosensitive channel n=1 Tax=Frigoribacterium faeni TaxID=145483 RepID=A0A7W3JH42_9MICO|nr:hypothetical protein [Frigoribacterium faeni]MBA8812686.1 small-conductance mechanosensitive channel [Frigoribacterium faeni]